MYRKLEQLLKEKNMSAYTLSKITGIPQSTIAEWKKNGRIPKVETMQKIAKELDVSMSYFLDDSTNEKE